MSELIDDIAIVSEEERTIPEVGSVDWTPYVMSLLDNTELSNDKPKCDGLRRVASVLGELGDIGPPIIHAIDRQYAAVTVPIVFNNKVVCGSAEVHPDNCGAPYNTYPLATAETRAESRALKRALLLSGVTTAEEINVNDSTPIPEGQSDKITPMQIHFAEQMCNESRLNVSVEQVIRFFNKDIEKIEDLPYEDFMAIGDKLSAWSNQKEELPKELDEKFDMNWREKFCR